MKFPLDADSSYSLLTSIVSNSRDAVIFLSENLDIISINSVATSLLNWEKKRVIGKNYFQAFDTNRSVKPIFKSPKRFQINKNIENIKQTIIRESGEKEYIFWNIYHIFDKHKKTKSHVLFGHDISKEMVLEGEYDLLKTFLGNLISQIPEYIYWKDCNFVYRGCNDLLAEMAGLKSREEVVGKKDEDFGWSSARLKALHKIDKKIISTGKSSVIEEVIPLPKDGSLRTMVSHKVPLRDQKKRIIGILGISIDITDRKKLEQQLLDAKEKAEVANQLKTEFMENMQHDLRTPAAGIHGVLDMLKNEDKNDDFHKLIGIAAKSAKELLELCNEVIDFENIDYGHHGIVSKEINIYKIALHIVDLNSSAIHDKGIGFIFEFDENIPQLVKGDSYRLKKILTNLLGNSIKFTKSGTIKLIVSKLNTINGQVFVKFEISDTGIGIPDNKKDLIFTKFTRLNPSNQGIYKGSGLGLSFVKKFVEELGGEINVESEVNVGTTFNVTLPFKISKNSKSFKNNKKFKSHSIAASSKKTEGVSEQASILLDLKEKIPLMENLSGMSVLLIEDDMLAKFGATIHFKKIGISIIDADSVLQAKEILDSKKFDLVVSDIGLPDGTGFDIINYIKKNKDALNYETPFVALTAHTNHEKISKAKKSGFLQIFEKPISAEVVENLVKNYTSNVSEKIQNDSHIIDGQEDLVIDLNVSMKMLGSTKKIAFEILELLCKNLPNDIRLIKDAYDKNDIKKMRDLLHKIEGGFCYCGVPRLKKITNELHDQVRKVHDLSSLKLLYDKFYVEVDNVMNEYFKIKKNNI